jgi:hypothetical protein
MTLYETRCADKQSTLISERRTHIPALSRFQRPRVFIFKPDRFSYALNLCSFAKKNCTWFFPVAGLRVDVITCGLQASTHFYPSTNICDSQVLRKLQFLCMKIRPKVNSQPEVTHVQ